MMIVKILILEECLMKIRTFLIVSFVVVISGNVFAAKGTSKKKSDSLYFPPRGSSWERIEASEAGWDPTKIEEVLKFVGEQRSSGIVILYSALPITTGKSLSNLDWEGMMLIGVLLCDSYKIHFT